MSYAQDVGTGAKSYGAYYNEKLLICHAGQNSYDKVAEALYNNGYYDHVKVFQKVDLNRRYAVEFDKNDVSERLLTNGLTVDGVHVSFTRHQRRVFSAPVWRVYISLLPSGVTDEEIISALQNYGKVKEVRPITRVLFERRYDTGDKFVFFASPHKDIPSYLNIRGWKAFIRYNNQPQTCRLCDRTGHFARECPMNPRNKPNEDQPDDQLAAEDMKTHTPEPDPTPEEINSTPTIQEEEPHLFSNASLQKEEGEPNLLGNVTIQDCTTTPTVENVTVLDCYTSSPTVENVSHEIEVTTQAKSWADSSIKTIRVLVQLRKNQIRSLTVLDAEWTPTRKQSVGTLFLSVLSRENSQSGSVS